MPNYGTDFDNVGVKSVDNITDFREFKNSDTDTDGVLTGSELTNITSTIGDFSAISETIPETTSFAATPATMLGKLGKQIAYFQNAIDPRRTVAAAPTYTVDSTAIAGTAITLTTAANLAVGTPVQFAFAADRDAVHKNTTYYIKSCSADAAAVLTVCAEAAGTGNALVPTDDNTNAIMTVVTSMINAGDVIKSMAHGLTAGTPVRFTGTGGGVLTTATYYAQTITTNTFQISTDVAGTSIQTLNADAINVYAVVPSAAELSYAAQLCSLKFNDMMDECLRLTYKLKRLGDMMDKIDDTGPLGTSIYPSGN